MSEPRTSKKCPHCPAAEAPKPIEEFARNPNRGDGHDGYCKKCKAKRARDLSAIRRGVTPAPVAALPVVTPAPVAALPPLEDAYARFDARQEKRDASERERALIEENRQLHKERAEVLKMSRAPTIIVYDKAKAFRSDAVACAVASDWHVEEPVEAATVHGLNEYNLEIAKSRAEHFFRNFLKLADIMARDVKINTLYLALLGDFFSGFIHDELVANNLLAPGDAAQFVKGLLFSGIDFLLRESSYVIEGDAICGNHGRMTDKIWIGDPTGTSLEAFMYASIQDRYHGNERVQIRVASQAMIYRRFFERFNMRLIHGYEVKYGGGVGGLTIPLNKALAAWNNPIRADLTVLGHFHQFLDGGEFLVNGSLIGYNTFAQAIRARYEEARQAFFMIHARGGGVKSIVAPIWLDDAHKAPRP